MRSLLAGNGESSVYRERIRRVKGTNDDWMGHGGASCGGAAVLTLLANFHAESTRYLLSRSNCFPRGMRQQQRRRRRRGGSLGRRLPTPTQRTGFERDEREEGRAEGEGERDGMQNYLRYGRGHLCRNETSASSAQPNFGNSPSLFLFRVVDANSYPLVFLEFRTARNLALSLSLGKFLRPSTSFAIGLICPTDDFARIDFAGCQTHSSWISQWISERDRAMRGRIFTISNSALNNRRKIFPFGDSRESSLPELPRGWKKSKRIWKIEGRWMIRRWIFLTIVRETWKRHLLLDK